MKALVPGLRKLVRNYPSALSTRTSSSFPSRTSTQTHRLAHTMAAVGHRYIDIGANLTDDMYQGMYNDKTYHAPDLEIVLKRAFAAGVERIIVTAGDLEQSKAALKLAQTDPRLFFTVGCHPTRGMSRPCIVTGWFHRERLLIVFPVFFFNTNTPTSSRRV